MRRVPGSWAALECRKCPRRFDQYGDDVLSTYWQLRFPPSHYRWVIWFCQEHDPAPDAIEVEGAIYYRFSPSPARALRGV